MKMIVSTLISVKLFLIEFKVVYCFANGPTARITIITDESLKRKPFNKLN